MNTRYTLLEANAILPLVRAIGTEIVERQRTRRALLRERDALEGASTPEGFTMALSDLDARVFEQEEGFRRSVMELEEIDLSVLRLSPLTIHFSGQTKRGKVVFCWEEGEQAVCHGHPTGDEEEPRRPLRIRASGPS
jgi:hypothetical protein